MKLSEKLSKNIFRWFALPDIRLFEENSPEKIIRRSLKVLDPSAVNSIKDFVESKHIQSGGFSDKAGKPDLYYTLFGYFLADALELKDLLPSLGNYVEKEISNNNIEGVHLHCAAILSSSLGLERFPRKFFRGKLRKSLEMQLNRNNPYYVFLNLMSSYHIRDYIGIFLISRKLKRLNIGVSLPGPVLAALLVLQKSFNKPVNDIEKYLMSFYNTAGGFKATQAAPVPDLLSTAVALYALGFSGYDLRMIKPDCLNFTDSLFMEGGFGSNYLDPEPDIEYTFYGLLALGSLADRNG
jgi:hypothetical protein